jgi:hypothetical protein
MGLWDVAFRLAMPVRRFVRVDLNGEEIPALESSDFIDELRDLPVPVNVFHVPYDLEPNPNYLEEEHKSESANMLKRQYYEYVDRHSDPDAINIIYSEGDRSSRGPLWMLHDVFHAEIERDSAMKNFYKKLRDALIADIGNSRLFASSGGIKSYFKQTDLLMYCMPLSVRKILPSSVDKIGKDGDNFDLFADLLVMYVKDAGIPHPNRLYYPGGLYEFSSRGKNIIRIPNESHRSNPGYRPYEWNDPSMEKTNELWNNTKASVYAHIRSKLESLRGAIVWGSRIPNPDPDASDRGKRSAPRPYEKPRPQSNSME